MVKVHAAKSEYPRTAILYRCGPQPQPASTAHLALDSYPAPGARSRHIERMEVVMVNLMTETYIESLLKQQAKLWAMEARAQRASLLEIYQALGIQKGDWNGARPVLDRIATLEAEAEGGRDAALVEAVGVASLLIHEWEEPMDEELTAYLNTAVRRVIKDISALRTAPEGAQTEAGIEDEGVVHLRNFHVGTINRTRR